MNIFIISAAVTLSKIIDLLSRLTGHKSSSLPGKIARIIYPKILSHLWKQVKHETIVVTGTNGKTTTNNMIRDILKAAGNTVVCNDVGANMINGVTTAFIKTSDFLGKLHADHACIEVDEASFTKVVDEIIPNKVVITNLFRDQLDRYGEIDLTIKKINSALDKLKNSNVTMILNADDPLTAQFKFKHNFNTLFFGVGETNICKTCEESREGRFCTFCGQELAYNYYFYSQLGDYFCPDCSFKRPQLDYYATNINTKDLISFDLKYNSEVEPISINYLGFYNIYNCLSAIGATISLISIKDIKNALNSYTPQIGRMERFNIFSKPLILNLSKNPAGFNQAINTVVSDNRQKNILIIINDNAQDGRDISWLWDCDFENLLVDNINKYYVSGTRREDMAVRLKYSDIPQSKIFIEEDIKNAITELMEDNIEIGYVLVNYTALFKTQDILKSLESIYGTDVKK